MKLTRELVLMPFSGPTISFSVQIRQFNFMIPNITMPEIIYLLKPTGILTTMALTKKQQSITHILFPKPGTYTIKLRVIDLRCNDTIYITKQNYIHITGVKAAFDNPEFTL